MHKPRTGVYIFVIGGEINVAGENLSRRDGIGIWDIESVTIEATSETQILAKMCIRDRIGTFYANQFSGNKLGIINTSSNKLNALLRIIDDQYVETVNMGELVEDAMPQILGELDPHSSYIPAKDLEAVNSDLKGSFRILLFIVMAIGPKNCQIHLL